MNKIKNYFYNLKNIKCNNYVLGNMSNDFDSTIGSIMTSIFLFLKYGKFYIPLFNITKDQFKYKFEIINHLKKYDLDLDDFYFIDTVELSNNTDKNIILYDHNKLINTQDYLKNHINGVIDHHLNLNYLDKTDDFLINKIRFSGSAIFLILEEYLSNNFNDEIYYKFSLPPILLDTYMFDENRKNKIWSDQDKIIFKSIQNILGYDINNYNNIYNDLIKEMVDLDNNLNIGLDNLLLKDYKYYHINNLKIGISSLSLDYDKFFSKLDLDNILAYYDDFIKKNNLDSYIITFNYNIDEVKKCIFFRSTDQIALQLIEFLKVDTREINLNSQVKLNFSNSLELSRKLLEKELNLMLS